MVLSRFSLLTVILTDTDSLLSDAVVWSLGVGHCRVPVNFGTGETVMVLQESSADRVPVNVHVVRL